MGFMGLKNWRESDEAADFQYKLSNSLNKLFKEELKNNANCYNTPGWVNALLLFKEYPNLISLLDDDILDKIDAKIEKDVEFSNHKELKQSFVPLVVNFRRLRDKLEGR